MVYAEEQKLFAQILEIFALKLPVFWEFVPPSTWKEFVAMQTTTTAQLTTSAVEVFAKKEHKRNAKHRTTFALYSNVTLQQPTAMLFSSMEPSAPITTFALPTILV